jgi:hypothetical protein
MLGFSEKNFLNQSARHLQEELRRAESRGGNKQTTKNHEHSHSQRKLEHSQGQAETKIRANHG